jgi:hypothetical protein
MYVLGKVELCLSNETLAQPHFDSSNEVAAVLWCTFLRKCLCVEQVREQGTESRQPFWALFVQEVRYFHSQPTYQLFTKYSSKDKKETLTAFFKGSLIEEQCDTEFSWLLGHCRDTQNYMGFTTIAHVDMLFGTLAWFFLCYHGIDEKRNSFVLLVKTDLFLDNLWAQLAQIENDLEKTAETTRSSLSFNGFSRARLRTTCFLKPGQTPENLFTQRFENPTGEREILDP